jgi:hypothetical protein
MLPWVDSGIASRDVASTEKSAIGIFMALLLQGKVNVYPTNGTTMTLAEVVIGVYSDYSISS